MADERDSKERFTDTVANYRLHRPGYPAGLCGVLAQRLGLRPGVRIAELGAGTGILTRDLLDFGAQVIAVEPNEAMRMAAEQDLGTRDGFHSIGGSAEATQLPDQVVDGIIAAQAFHWFDPAATRKECLRIGTSSVWAAIIWNTRRLTGSRFAEAYEQFCQDWGGDDYGKVAGSWADAEKLEAFFGRKPQLERLANAQEHDRQGLIGRLRSCSYIPGHLDPRFADMLRAIDELFDAHAEDGRVFIEYDTEVFWGRLPAAN